MIYCCFRRAFVKLRKSGFQISVIRIRLSGYGTVYGCRVLGFRIAAEKLLAVGFRVVEFLALGC